VDAEVQATKKRRLVEGPSAFRETRVDRPKRGPPGSAAGIDRASDPTGRRGKSEKK